MTSMETLSTDFKRIQVGVIYISQERDIMKWGETLPDFQSL